MSATATDAALAPVRALIAAFHDKFFLREVTAQGSLLSSVGEILQITATLPLEEVAGFHPLLAPPHTCSFVASSCNEQLHSIQHAAYRIGSRNAFFDASLALGRALEIQHPALQPRLRSTELLRAIDDLRQWDHELVIHCETSIGQLLLRVRDYLQKVRTPEYATKFGGNGWVLAPLLVAFLHASAAPSDPALVSTGHWTVLSNLNWAEDKRVGRNDHELMMVLEPLRTLQFLPKFHSWPLQGDTVPIPAACHEALRRAMYALLAETCGDQLNALLADTTRATDAVKVYGAGLM